METVGNRIRQIRKTKDKTLAQFGKAIGITAASLSNIENGKTNPSKQTFSIICSKFSVDEVWLRTGVGEMFRPRSREDEITGFCTDLIGEDATDFQRDFVAVLAKLTPEEWDLLEAKINELAELAQKRRDKQK